MFIFHAPKFQPCDPVLLENVLVLKHPPNSCRVEVSNALGQLLQIIWMVAQVLPLEGLLATFEFVDTFFLEVVVSVRVDIFLVEATNDSKALSRVIRVARITRIV